MDKDQKSMYRYSIILIIFALIFVFVIQSGILEEVYSYLKNMFMEQNNASFKTFNYIVKGILLKS